MNLEFTNKLNLEIEKNIELWTRGTVFIPLMKYTVLSEDKEEVKALLNLVVETQSKFINVPVNYTLTFKDPFIGIAKEKNKWQNMT